MVRPLNLFFKYVCLPLIVRLRGFAFKYHSYYITYKYLQILHFGQFALDTINVRVVLDCIFLKDVTRDILVVLEISFDSPKTITNYNWQSGYY